MAREAYEAQVALLVRILPYVAKEEIFALKGGTAINLFYRDLPRLSVDIDLTFLPIKDRTESLAEINAAMDRIADAIESGIKGAQARRIQGGGGGATRVLARLDSAEVKIETSPVMRGVVHDPEMRAVSDAVAEEFGYAEMQVISFEDLFGPIRSQQEEHAHKTRRARPIGHGPHHLGKLAQVGCGVVLGSGKVG